MDQPRTNGVRSIYRSLLLRGLEPGEAANVTAFLHGLPSAGLSWTVAEVEAVIRTRADHLRPSDISLDDLAEAPPLTWQPS
jgi:hypothetical protein